MSIFNFDILDNPKPLDLYLCKPDGTIICNLNGIDDSSASITINLNNIYELSFDYYKYINLENGTQVLTNGYDSLSFGMTILVENIGYFKMEYPEEKFDGEKDFKSITANSIDCELSDKDLVDFKINTGEVSSLEYLVTYDEDETEELLNAYTGLPYDYIVFYNTYPEQLANILNKYDDGIYETPDIINDIKKYTDLTSRLKSKITTVDGVSSLEEFVIYTYDDSGANIIKVELLNFNERINQLITFYTKYRNQLSLIPLSIEKCNCNWSVGIIDESLLNKKFQFDEDSTNIYSFLTQTVASAINCPITFDIFQKTINAILIDNIGEDSGVILDRYNLVNTVDISCDENSICTRYNVKGGNDIGIQYVNFGTSRIDDLSYFLNARDNNGNRLYVSDELAAKYKQFVIDRDLAREIYVSLTKSYNQALIDINEIKYKVPNDCVQNDWDTFTNAELEASLVTYNQLLVTLESLYKEEYGNIGCNADGSINEDYIRTTEYWYDYFAYKQAIEQIKAAIYAHSQDSSYTDIDNETVLKTIYAYKTEWSLYGTIELQNKITAYNNNMQVLIDGETVVLKDGSDEAKTWDELTDAEKTDYSYLDMNYQYDAYMQYYTERESCQEYLDTLMTQLESLEESLNTAQSNRTKLVELVTFETYNRAELSKLITLPPSDISGTFTTDEIKTINSLYIDKDYSNENILTTSLDTTVSEVDIQYELLEDAIENLSIESQPQISFSTDIDNLLCVKEFQNFKFNIGNFVYLQYYDNYYVKLRLASMAFNPCVPTDDLEVTFTNFIKSRAKRTDISYILGLATGGSSNSSSNSGSGSSSVFGDSSDIDITISNTMLSKLLNTEMFGTRVSNIILDTIKVNQINAKYAKFDGLAKGTTIIDGACIQTGAIISNNYNGTIKTNSSGYVTSYDLNNTSGSILELTEGKFNFGGGKLKWDGNILSVEGKITATSGYIGGTTGFEIGSTYIRNGKIMSATNTTISGVYVGTDGFNVSGGSPATTSYFTKSGMNIGGKLKWNGNILSVEGDIITDNLNATGGTIGGYTIDEFALYNGTTSIAGNSNSIYLGIDGISCGTSFKVTNDGKITANSGTIGMFTINNDDNGLYAYYDDSHSVQQYGLGYNRFFVYLRGTDGNFCGHIDLDNGLSSEKDKSPDLSIGSSGSVNIATGSKVIFSDITYNESGVNSSNIRVEIANTGEIISYSANAFRAIYGSYGFIIRNDGNNTYFLLTNPDDQDGTFNNLRPLYIDNSTGAVTISTLNTTGNTTIAGASRLQGEVFSTNIRDNTATSVSANVCVNSNGRILKSSSASKYKLDIKPLEQDSDYAYNILKLEPKQWFDKTSIENYASILTAEYNGDKLDNDIAKSVDTIDSCYGLIAEDVIDAGLGKYCFYNNEKEVEGIMYDRLWTLLIPVVRDLKNQVNELTKKIEKLN